MSRAHNLGPDLGPRTDPADRARAAALFIGQFDAGNEVDTAIAADEGLGG